MYAVELKTNLPHLEASFYENLKEYMETKKIELNVLN
jgi:hypothetical protein